MGWIHGILKSPLYGKGVGQSDKSFDHDEVFERFSLKSKSGADLSVLVAKADSKQEKATIVLAHPAVEEGKQYFITSGYTEFLRNNGYNVLLFDFNGFLESSMGNFSFHEDILSVGTKAKDLFPDLPLGLHGIGMGANWAINAFTDYNHRFSFAILEDAATSWSDLWKSVPKAVWISNALKLFSSSLRNNTNFLKKTKEMKNLQSVLFVSSEEEKETLTMFGKSCKLINESWTIKSEDKTSEAYLEKIESYFDKQQLYYYRKHNN